MTNATLGERRERTLLDDHVGVVSLLVADDEAPSATFNDLVWTGEHCAVHVVQRDLDDVGVGVVPHACILWTSLPLSHDWKSAAGLALGGHVRLRRRVNERFKLEPQQC